MLSHPINGECANVSSSWTSRTSVKYYCLIFQTTTRNVWRILFFSNLFFINCEVMMIHWSFYNCTYVNAIRKKKVWLRDVLYLIEVNLSLCHGINYLKFKLKLNQTSCTRWLFNYLSVVIDLSLNKFIKINKFCSGRA